MANTDVARLVQREYVRIDPVEGRLPSEVLGLHLEQNGSDLRLYDPATGQYLPTPEERLEEVEAERRQADEARRQAEAQRERSDEARRQAEAEVERLRREIEALRRPPPPA